MLEKYRWNQAQKKVNSAVKTLSAHNLGYSVIDGLTGNIGKVSDKEYKKIHAAANTMGRFQAGYYPNPVRKDNNSNISNVKPAHYEPMEFSDYALSQDKAIKQSKSSMHLRSVQTFIQRICYDPRLQAHPNKWLLKLSPEETSLWASKTEALWRQDKQLKSWDIAKKNNYNQLSHIALKQLIEIGEFFAVIRSYMDDPERTTNISIQLFNPLQIQSPRLAYGQYAYSVSYRDCNNIVNVSCKEYYDNMPKGNYIEKGIEFNREGEEIAIFIAPTEFGEPYQKIPFRNKNGFQQVLHGFIQTEAGQIRGLPDSVYAHHEFLNIRDLGRFEMQSAKLNSTISGTVTADSNAQPGGSQGGIENMGKVAGWGSINTEIESLEYSDPGYSVREVEGGGYVVQNFTPGYKYTEHRTDRPNTNVPVFIEKNLEYTHPATYGIATTLASQKLEGSYNASKGKIDLSWKTGIEFYLKQFASDWDKHLYNAWLNGKIATGKIIAPGWDDPELRNAWASMTIIIPAKPSLNPLQEAKAGELRISMGASNAEYEAQQQTGTSFDENVDRIKEEQKRLRDAMPEIIEPVTEELTNA